MSGERMIAVSASGPEPGIVVVPRTSPALPAASPIAARRSSAMSRSRSKGPEEALSTSSSRARPGATHSKK